MSQHTGYEYNGGCHCGQLTLRFHASRPLAALGLRACTCSFCRPRRARWTSDPSGQVEIVAADESELSRYRFATETATFVICRRCGVLVAAFDGQRAVINVDILELDFELPPAVDTELRAEDRQTRLARRARTWTPATLRVSGE